MIKPAEHQREASYSWRIGRNDTCTMRLLNTTTFELQEFFDTSVPPYAILSHRWEDDETTFKDVKKRRNLNAKGWLKAQSCCRLAEADGHKWLWVDTCCIDKRSSAELSEAINSMFRWYEDAEECYVYLSDVDCEGGDLCTEEEIRSWSDRKIATNFWISDHEDLTDMRAVHHTSGLRSELAAALRASKWFTRGWTLQELLAPSVVRFIDRDFKGVLGSKVSLNKIVSQITGIPNAGFRNARNMRFVSIAAKMCWASRRICTRGEDVAYSLLGIFNVNMPLLYGEGTYKAFLRLQLEILKESDDESIFAWYPGDLPSDSNYKRPEIKGGLLAGSPSYFSLPRLAKVQPLTERRARRVPYTMTNKGLAIKATLQPEGDYDINKSDKYFKMALFCYVSKDKQPLAIRLIRTGQYSFARILGPGVEMIREWDPALFNEKGRESHRTHQLDEENRIYVPQAPYPELQIRSMESIKSFDDGTRGRRYVERRTTLANHEAATTSRTQSGEQHGDGNTAREHIEMPLSPATQSISTLLADSESDSLGEEFDGDFFWSGLTYSGGQPNQSDGFESD